MSILFLIVVAGVPLVVLLLSGLKYSWLWVIGGALFTAAGVGLAIYGTVTLAFARDRSSTIIGESALEIGGGFAAIVFGIILLLAAAIRLRSRGRAPGA